MSVNEMLMAAAGAGGPSEYVEDVFSTWLYTGNGTARTITTGIDLSTKGGLLWFKRRNGVSNHNLFDTVRGNTKYISSNLTAAEGTITDALTGFTSTGFTLGTDASGLQVNTNNETYASWTFRKAPKFFDVVTYTGDGVAGRTVAHNLGSVPGMIIVKKTNTTGPWQVFHRSLTATDRIFLNLSDAKETTSLAWNNTEPTSTVFTVGNSSAVNTSGDTYVAYLFAHNAGGFGDAGTDNIISCGSVTTDGSGNATVNLGYEPQYVLWKRSDGIGGSWFIWDIMREFSQQGAAPLYANASNAEGGVDALRIPNATGFTVNTSANATFIYMAIRRPMKKPTAGTEVFSPVIYTGNGSTQTLTTDFPVDYMINMDRPFNSNNFALDRLTNEWYYTNVSGQGSAALNSSTEVAFDNNTGFRLGSNGKFNSSSITYIAECFKRATGFFDLVCYTGTGTARTVTHNLGVVPEMMIINRRDTSSFQLVYHSAIGNSDSVALYSSSGTAGSNSIWWNNTTPTSSVFTVGTSSVVNNSGSTYVAQLFASVNSVSKVGSYTGNGSSQTINCGFSAGARFVLIKRTDSTGDWCVFDTARGIVSGNDPFLQLNSTAAEVTGEDAVDPANSGFIVNQTTEALNTNGATYIFLAVA